MPLNNFYCLLMVIFLTIFTAGAQDNEVFVLVHTGKYTIGKKGHLLNPQRTVRADSFFIARTETTNQQFAVFVQATGYITDAERKHDALVFAPGLKEFQWMEDSTAYWRYPNGIHLGGIDHKMDHPVTCISYTDALAYCQWARRRLPTLAEWEIACRAGTGTDYYFGNDRKAIGSFANIWHGRDHLTADNFRWLHVYVASSQFYTQCLGSF